MIVIIIIIIIIYLFVDLLIKLGYWNQNQRKNVFINLI